MTDRRLPSTVEPCTCTRALGGRFIESESPPVVRGAPDEVTAKSQDHPAGQLRPESTRKHQWSTEIALNRVTDRGSTSRIEQGAANHSTRRHDEVNLLPPIAPPSRAGRMPWLPADERRDRSDPAAGQGSGIVRPCQRCSSVSAADSGSVPTVLMARGWTDHRGAGPGGP